jgi:hypothetical protein
VSNWLAIGDRHRHPSPGGCPPPQPGQLGTSARNDRLSARMHTSRTTVQAPSVSPELENTWPTRRTRPLNVLFHRPLLLPERGAVLRSRTGAVLLPASGASHWEKTTTTMTSESRQALHVLHRTAHNLRMQAGTLETPGPDPGRIHPTGSTAAHPASTAQTTSAVALMMTNSQSCEGARAAQRAAQSEADSVMEYLQENAQEPGRRHPGFHWAHTETSQEWHADPRHHGSTRSKSSLHAHCTRPGNSLETVTAQSVMARTALNYVQESHTDFHLWPSGQCPVATRASQVARQAADTDGPHAHVDSSAEEAAATAA